MLKQKNLPTATNLKLAYFKSTDRMQDIASLNTHSGVNYLTFYYSALEFKNIVDRLNKQGIPIIGWVKRVNYQLLFVKDPDGVFVEVVSKN